MERRSKWQGLLSIVLAFVIAAGVFLPTIALADEGMVLTELTITGLELPQAGSAFPSEATVSSAEGVSWQIPVFWVDESGALAPDIAGDGTHYPVFVLFIPEGSVVQGEDGETGSLRLTMDGAILALFGTDKISSVFDAETGLTYIILGDINFVPPRVVPAYGPLGPDQEVDNSDSYRNPHYVERDPEATTEENGSEEEIEPAEPEPKETPVPAAENEETGSDPSAQEEEPEPQEDPLGLELIPIHCAKTAQKALEPEELASLVDMIRYKIQPQAVNILIDRFPAFRKAYDEGLIGQNLGLYVYAFEGDKDGVETHQKIPKTWTAFAKYRFYDYTDFCYMMGVNARYLFALDEKNRYVKDEETGKYMLTEDEQRIQDMESTMIHEMLHLFMYDYNRVGMTGRTHPDQGRDPELTREDKEELAVLTSFPIWFKEGLACSVENTYQYRYGSFKRLRYLGNGEYDEYYTPENVLRAYQLTTFRSDGNRDYESHYELDLADDPNVQNKVNAQYLSGYLACLYLAELAANQKGVSSVTEDEARGFIMKSDPLREGINTILERLHKGETLDELIKDLSGGRFADTTEFEKKFIKGDEDSLEFCVVYLNYMQELSEEPDREYLPNGSILLDFELDYASPLDRNVQGAENAYVFSDSDTVVPSTVELLRAYTNGGRSYRGIYDDEDFQYDDAPDDEIFPEEDSEYEDEEDASAFDEENLAQDEAEDLAAEEFGDFEEEYAPAQDFESDISDSAFEDDGSDGWDDGE